MQDVLTATTALRDWATETGQPLPADATVIALAETAGVFVDLETGGISGVADDGMQTLDDQSWLAVLEWAGNGRVVVAWAMTPEAYFAQAEAEKRA